VERQIVLKLCIFGDGGVGKTTLSKRYLTGEFDSTVRITLGMEIHVKYLKVEGYNVALQIWDFGGEPQFRHLLKNYARGSFGGIFIYDITRMNTTLYIDEWLSIFKDTLGSEAPEVPILIVGGKSDLTEDRGVSGEEAKKLKNQFQFFDHLECSAKTGENVDKIFEILIKEILKIRGFT